MFLHGQVQRSKQREKSGDTYIEFLLLESVLQRRKDLHNVCEYPMTPDALTIRDRMYDSIKIKRKVYTFHNLLSIRQERLVKLASNYVAYTKPTCTKPSFAYQVCPVGLLIGQIC